VRSLAKGPDDLERRQPADSLFENHPLSREIDVAHDHSDENEVSADQLFSRFDRQPDPVVDAKIEFLPLHDRLTPDNFERLVARLASPPDGTSVRATRYGKSGSTQGGIDVMCDDPVAGKCDYYEGKRWARISKGDIAGWVDKFLSGPHALDARKFVLCTTFNVEDVTDLVLEWKACARVLAARKIAGELWDGAEIHRMLRRKHAVVSELFGDEVAKRYCVQEIRQPSEPPERTFAAREVSQFGRSLSLKNVSVACDVMLPNDEEIGLTASLSFARRELSGISIAVSGKELVRWMQWRAHATSGSQRPYVVPLPDDDGRVVLTADSARLTLRSDELHHLDWVLEAGWKAFYAEAAKQLVRLRCGRFKRLRGSSGPFVLASVDRPLWRAMLGFAQEHDVANGDGPWHVFDGAPGCLKVYTQGATDRLDAGYHAILYAYDEGGIWLPWESSVSIGWEVPTNFGTPVRPSPRATWDAEYTHDWLIEEFIPEVLRWANAPSAEPQKKKLWQRAPAAKAPAIAEPVATYATSAAMGLSVRTMPDDFEGLQRCVRKLQVHFHGRRSDVELEPALGAAVLSAIHRILSFTKLAHEGYLRSSVGIPSNEGLVEGVRARSQSGTVSTSQAAMDFRLRGLLEAMDASKSVPAGEWRGIAASLQPLLDRYHEDVVCDLFTAG
jgi:hypothetical protein